MASYRLLIKPSAAKELEAVPREDRRRIVARIQRLSDEPRPPKCEKLSGHDLCRMRQGSHRILYTVHDSDSAVVIITIGYRRDTRAVGLPN